MVQRVVNYLEKDSFFFRVPFSVLVLGTAPTFDAILLCSSQSEISLLVVTRRLLCHNRVMRLEVLDNLLWLFAASGRTGWTSKRQGYL